MVEKLGSQMCEELGAREGAACIWSTWKSWRGKARVQVLHSLRYSRDLLPREGSLCLAIHQGKGGHCVRRVSGNGFHTGSSEPQDCSGQGPRGSFLGARGRLSYDLFLILSPTELLLLFPGEGAVGKHFLGIFTYVIEIKIT